MDLRDLSVMLAMSWASRTGPALSRRPMVTGEAGPRAAEVSCRHSSHQAEQLRPRKMANPRSGSPARLALESWTAAVFSSTFSSEAPR